MRKLYADTKITKHIKSHTAIIKTAQAAERPGVSVRRVQQLVKDGRLPADWFGGSLMIRDEDLKLVEHRKAGRPPKAKTGPADKTSKKQGKG